MVKLKEIRKIAVERLKKVNNDSPLADADYVLKGMGFSKNDILLGDKFFDEETEKLFLQAIARVEEGEPVQYVVGKAEFMSLDFEVTPATLIPRSDTETLVEAVLKHCEGKKTLNILEVGSGTGCISVSLAHFLPCANVLSVDISPDAIEVAKRNALANGVSDRVKFIEHDIFKGFPEFGALPDVIVSNPPYIPSRDITDLEKKVKDFEPLNALDGGEDGLDFYRYMVQNAKLAPNGMLAFEVGINQANSVFSMMKAHFSDVDIINDIAGVQRVVTGIFKI